MFSSTELFPLDCDPTTAICGKSMGFCTCRRQQRQLLVTECKEIRNEGSTTYSDRGKDILQLIYESDELGIVDIDPAQVLAVGNED